MKTFLAHLFKSFLRPEKPLDRISVFKKILRLPIIYDVTSLCLQAVYLKHLSRVDIIDAETDEYHASVQKYNAKVTTYKQYSMTRRAEELFAALALRPLGTAEENILLIGPRTVQEFHLAWLYGFSWKRIEGIDLYQTHPKIRVMNMEAMTHANSSFDAIVMSATLPYAKDVYQCLSECARVLKPGGHLVFTQTYCPESELYPGNKVNGATTLTYLIKLGFKPFYYREVDKVNKLGLQQTRHLFGVQKKLSDPAFDEIPWDVKKVC